MRRAPHILVIEDDVETRELIVEELTEHGFAVTAAAAGREGLAAMQVRSPDLVLCDVMMPGMSGFELLEELTRDGRLHDGVPFVFLTALGSREDMLRGRRLGADDYITKPIDFDLLVEVIRARCAGIARTRHRIPAALTERELEMLTWVARGKSSADIAVIAGISERTVNFHVENAMHKLGVASRVQAVVQATRGGLIRP